MAIFSSGHNEGCVHWSERKLYGMYDYIAPPDGALTHILTKGSLIKDPLEMVLTFQLYQPVRIVEAK
jgi:hypothetical protein